MDNKHIKRCSTLLAIKGKEIKTTLRYYLTPARIPIIKKTITRADEDVRS